MVDYPVQHETLYGIIAKDEFDILYQLASIQDEVVFATQDEVDT